MENMDEVVKKHGIEPRIIQEIGNRVREIRTRLGHSMDSFAALIESTSATISNIENGKGVPSGAILLKISKACSVSADWILNGEEAKEQEHVKEAAGTSIFFRGKWQIYSRLSNGYMSEEDRQIHDAVFSLLDSIQQLSEEKIALLRAVAEKFEKK
jgi:transcriptional regulator with XRE-family HTH domain